MNTRAVIFSGCGKVATGETQIPELGPTDVLVRSKMSGVSVGTDGWILSNKFQWVGEIPYPVVPGYQRAGWVEAVGSEVSHLHVGQRVAATTSRLVGSPQSFWGGHLHLGVTDQSEIYPLDDRISFESAAQMIVSQVGYNAATRSGASSGQNVLVLGDGCIGQMAAQVARSRGAKVTLAGHRAERLKIAEGSGCEETLDTHDATWVKRLASDDSPISAVIDTVQNQTFFEGYSKSLRPQTNVILSGFSIDGFTADLDHLQKREIGIQTVSGWTRKRNEETLACMVAGEICWDHLFTHIVEASKASEIYSMIESKAGHFLGVNFLWE